MFKKGDLVRVRESAVHKYIINRSLVRDHGYLWIIIKEKTGYHNEFFAKSLATGHISSQWFADELEKADV